MGIYCTCGHEVFSGNDMIPVEYDDEDIDFDGPEPVFVPVTILATYCPKCTDEGVKSGRVRKVTQILGTTMPVSYDDEVTQEQVEAIDRLLAEEFADGVWETVEKE